MYIDLYGRSFLTLSDYTREEILYLLQLASQLKQKRKQGNYTRLLDNKNIILLFEKTSTRTRCAFEVGAGEEGARVTYLDISSSQFGKKESVEDSAILFGKFYDAIGYRGFAQKTVEELAKYSQIPVYNGLTDEDHPTQILADLMTIQEKIPYKPLNQIKVVFVGDTRNNMAYGWINAAAKLGIDFVAYGPRELAPDTRKLELIMAINPEVKIKVSDNPKCLVDADIVYTDIWASMGEEAQTKERALLLQNYMVTIDLLRQTNNPDVLFMHCLPAYHDFNTTVVKEMHNNYGVNICEVSDEVFRSRHSIVFAQAENRLHTIKAVMVATLYRKT